jgi:hypothetical protein
VLNEREVRAAAGILFLFALIAFMNAWLTGDFYYTRVFVIAFLIDFSIRIFVNPRYSPTMIAGRLFVRRQNEELVGAPQKQFAWSIGFALAITMFFLIVVNKVIGPFNLIICLTCLVLLFFESVFGICIACKIYNLVFKEKAKLCPGNVCEVPGGKQATRITAGESTIALLFVVAIVAAGRMIPSEAPPAPVLSASTAALGASPSAAPTGKDCTVPSWATAIGHTEKWKLHNNCK